MEIQPIETFVFDGLVKRFTNVFGCRAIITTTEDKSRTLQKFSDGKPLEYPYAFLTVQSVAVNKESYQNRMLTRRGVGIVMGQDQMQMVRLLPTNFVIEVEFFTNEFQGSHKSVLGYARRWLFAQGCGFLKFNIKYGRLETPIGVTMDDNVSTPLLANKVEAESAYKIVASLTVHGWTSEPILGSQGVIGEVDVDFAVSSKDGYVFEPFN